MKHLFTLLFPLLSALSGIAQLTGHLEAGIGNQGDDNSKILTDVAIGAGYSIYDNLYFFSGMKLQTHYWIDPVRIKDFEEDNWDLTSRLHTISIYTGSRLSVNLFQFKEGAKFKHFGFFPEFRLYFDPWIPRKFSYSHDYNIVTQKGPFESQLSYGYGGGIYIGSVHEAYFALKFEYRNADPYRTLRKMDYPGEEFDFPEANQFLLSLSVQFK